MVEDKMENGHWLWANEEVESIKEQEIKEIPREMTKKKELSEIEKGLWFKQSSLITCNTQVSRGAPAASSSHSNLK